MRLYYLCKTALYAIFKRRTFGARILLIKDNMILLVKHTYMPGWYTIGGGVDAGESPAEAVVRELKEEVGVTLKQPPKLFAVYHNTFERRDDYIVLYTGAEHEIIPIKCNEILEMKWFALDNLPSDVTPGTQRRINEYLGKISISDKW